ncbi:hypothetical protein JCM30566_09060 [Marinitoga arctica]
MLFMFKSNTRSYLNIISWILLGISIFLLPFSYIFAQNKIYNHKIEIAKSNESIMENYNQRLENTKKANKNLYDFLDFLEQINSNVYINEIYYTPISLNSTITIEVINGVKIISPYQIKEIKTLDLLYKQYKILEMKK